MRIKSLRLQNFKRFTDVTVDKIPEDAKLVLLIGANGSGKSSVFDAFDYIKKSFFIKEPNYQAYYSKDGSRLPSFFSKQIWESFIIMIQN